jgi:hypothetical protein
LSKKSAIQRAEKYRSISASEISADHSISSFVSDDIPDGIHSQEILLNPEAKRRASAISYSQTGHP